MKDKKKINELIISFLEEELKCEKKQHSEKELICSLEKKYIYKKGDHSQSNTIASLDYDNVLTNTFLSGATYKELRSILGSSLEFFKKDAKEKKEIQNQLDILNKDEYQWKTIQKRNKHKPSSCHHELFPKEYSLFKEGFNKLRNKEKKTIKKYSLSYKIKKLTTGLAEFLEEDSPIFKKILLLTDNDFESIAETVNPQFLFNDVCRIVLKGAHDNTFNENIRRSSKYVDRMRSDILVMSKLSVARDLEVALSMYYMSLTMEYLYSTEDVEFQHESIGKILRRTLRHKRPFFETTTTKGWWGLHCDGVRSLLLLLEYTKIFELRTDYIRQIDGSVKPSLKYMVPLDLNETLVQFTNFPRVVSERISYDDFSDRIKPIFKGNVHITPSDEFIETLNTSASKTYRINDTYCDLLEKMLNSRLPKHYEEALQCFELPFEFIDTIENKQKQLNCLREKVSLSSEQMHVKDQFEIQMAGKEKSVKLKKSTLQSLFCIPKALQKMKLKSYELSVEITQLLFDRKWANTLLKLAHVYKDFPLYISDDLCSRGRLYPRQPLISRTSGIYKHLLCDFKSQKLTLDGYKMFLKAYYKPSEEQSVKFEEFLKLNLEVLSKKTGVKTLRKYFQENPLNFFSTKSKFLYFALMHLELIKAFESGSTSMCIEIDQVASGVMLFSYLLRDKKMAQAANAIGGCKSDPYIYCRDKFKEFYDLHIKEKSDVVLNFLSTDRKAHKYALMCFTYSQTYFGRNMDILSKFKETYGPVAFDSPEKKSISEFSLKYPLFVDYVFTGVTAKLKLIYKVVALAIKELDYLPFANIQQEKFSWSFYKYKSTTRSSYDALTSKSKKYKSYKLEEVLTEESKSEANDDSVKKTIRKLVIDTKIFEKKALSYIIHCIDASIIHRFIMRMKKNHKYEINHLHDCVMLHPNYVPHFYQEVKDLYSSKELYNIIDNLFFDQILSRVSLNTGVKIMNLRDEFNALSDSYEDLLPYSVPEHIYEFEG